MWRIQWYENQCTWRSQELWLFKNLCIIPWRKDSLICQEVGPTKAHQRVSLALCYLMMDNSMVWILFLVNFLQSWCIFYLLCILQITEYFLYGIKREEAFYLLFWQKCTINYNVMSVLLLVTIMIGLYESYTSSHKL